jgi:predicted lipoprotein with Yx(FWY)xxD motif
MGYEHAVALKSDGTLVVWGTNSHGQLDVPAGLSDVVAVSTADYHTLALKADGTVVAWGANWNGQLNLPSELSDVVAVSAGEPVNLALKKDGTIVQWGSTAYAKPVPYGLGSVVAIAASTQGQSASAITVQENASARYALQAIGADIDKLAGLIAGRVLAALPDNYGIATKADLGTAVSDATSQAIAQVQAAPNEYDLYSSTQYQANRITGVAEGKAEVTSNPTAYSLFTESSIMDMNLGSLMLKKRADANALDLELTIETKDNLTTDGWQVAERITRLVSMVGVQRQFLRVRADAPYVAPDVEVLAHPTLGNILTDGAGRVLYYFAADTPGGNPLFSGSSWPYVTVPPAPKADAGVSAMLASSTFGKPGGPYLTVNARPVYTYVGDAEAGQANGHGAGSVWWTIKVDGAINQ